MASERIQRQIDSLLDEAEAAIRDDDWVLVRQRANAVLRLDHANEDAATFLEAADHEPGEPGAVAHAPTAPAPSAPPTPTAPPHPERFAGDRYEVRRHLGDGGTKLVFLLTRVRPFQARRIPDERGAKSAAASGAHLL